jgi:phosphoribosylformimino-5-aminoimidazole carboxamide ribonucleotide (ProFAR) isomerase
VVQVMEMNLSGVIIGRALYEGRVDLGQAIALSAI